MAGALRQDLMRGIRWGTILLLVMLLSITAYRLLSSSEAAASPAKAGPEQSTEELTPAPEVAPAAAIQVGEPVLKGPDAPAAPPAQAPPAQAKARKAKAAPVVPEPPQRLQAPRFAPLPPALAPKAQSNAFVAETLPEPVPAPTPAVDLPVPSAVPAAPAATPAAENTKQGNRATRAVRSVGRLFRFGRKDEAEPKK